ncbi:MAG TPA: double-strand break repair helicase AddA, partial [Rhodospirillaceae bacterium]|nr:double-strand break repair helicase AddA [Rhodospirillaceae bacterium]
FCQSLLRRFPLEAGLAPHFQVMDDRDSAEILAAARETVLAAAAGRAELAAALAVLTGRVRETGFSDLLGELAGERGKFTRLLAAYGSVDGVIAALGHRLGLAEGDSAAAILAAGTVDEAFDVAGLRRAAEAMLAGSEAEAKRGRVMADWLADPPGRPAAFDAWSGAVLTAKGDIRATPCAKPTEARAPGSREVLLVESQRLLDMRERLRAAATLEGSAALLRLGQAILAEYARAKEARAQLDYDDLVDGAVTLLERPGLSAWVLYKLDGGIDHLLIDEAQDTSPDQWRVVSALTGEFFAGIGAREEERTVFAVGDAKQSIYSFQGADPRGFEAMRRRLAEAVPAAGKRWDEVSLELSFRSAPAVLTAVDLVFGGVAGDGVVAPGQTLIHRPWRAGAGGLVELWPPIEPRERDEPEPWKPPVERVRGDSPRTRLARLLAARIKAMVGGEERLASRDRPIRPGDILVLVRRRNAFVEELVRELKGHAVAVAGADRMILTEQMAVMDLMALGNALLLPEDDLTLATVLKGPLLGLDEEQLFQLAHGRAGSIWEALRRRRDEAPYGEALARLEGWRDLADRMPPHDLFGRLLVEGGRAALLARLGPEAEDPLDEFIGLTLAYERLHPPSLQGFLGWLEQGGMEIKRDMEAAGGAVRIMTVHGAKGLQAPIVFLPDTLQVPRKSRKLVTLEEDGLMLWAPAADDQEAVCRAARAAEAVRRDQEYRRLLYVAMTRAEDRLYICGWAGRQAPPDGSWYRLVESALADPAETVADPWLATRAESSGGTVLRLSSPQTAAPQGTSRPDAVGEAAALPDWVRRAAPAEPRPPRPLAPSQDDGEESCGAGPPLGSDGGRRFRRGQLIHRLLQSLPEVALAERHAAAARFLGRPAWGLSVAEQVEIAGEVGTVLADRRFAPLFGPGSQAEVPLVGRIGDRLVCGRVDRLLVTGSEVLVVDYKTDRPAPDRPSAVSPGYLRQMAAYRAALACIYPGRQIVCAFLWTDLPRLMPLDGRLLDGNLLAGIDPPAIAAGGDQDQ